METQSEKRKKQSHCFVPNCRTGYKSNKNTAKVSLFSTPFRDPSMLQRWSDAIGRTDKTIDASCSVCELHFEPHFVKKYFRYIIKGEEVFEPRQKPSLSSDAVPTIFNDSRNPLTEPLTIEQKRQQVFVPQHQQSILLTHESVPTAIPNSHSPSTRHPPVQQEGETQSINNFVKRIKVEYDDVNDNTYTKNDLSLEALCEVKLPSPFWVKIMYKNTPNIVCFALFNSPENFIAYKQVVVEKTDSEVSCTLHFNNISEKQSITSIEDLQAILYDVEQKQLCMGVGDYEKFKELKNVKKKFTVEGNVLRYSGCDGIVEKVRICDECKYQRKLLLNQLSRNSSKELEIELCGDLPDVKTLKKRAQRVESRIKKIEELILP